MNGFWINPSHPPTHSSLSIVLLYKHCVKSGQFCYTESQCDSDCVSCSDNVIMIGRMQELHCLSLLDSWLMAPHKIRTCCGWQHEATESQEEKVPVWTRSLHCPPCEQLRLYIHGKWAGLTVGWKTCMTAQFQTPFTQMHITHSQKGTLQQQHPRSGVSASQGFH